MKRARTPDLRPQVPQVEHRLHDGEDTEITNRGPMARSGSNASSSRPDFLRRLRKLYGKKVLKPSGAELLANERSR
jgi:hypothetical protein